jgi:hypothetical protein
MTTKQPHILVVTGEYDIGDQIDDRKYEIECPGVTDACAMWIPCDCAAAARPDQLWEDPVAHGVEHQNIDGEWMTQTDQCLYAGHDSLPDVAADMREPGPARRELDPGRYPVVPDYQGDGWFYLDLVTDEAVTP